MKGVIYYKYKSESEFDEIEFDGTFISITDLKMKILARKKGYQALQDSEKLQSHQRVLIERVSSQNSVRQAGMCQICQRPAQELYNMNCTGEQRTGCRSCLLEHHKNTGLCHFCNKQVDISHFTYTRGMEGNFQGHNNMGNYHRPHQMNEHGYGNRFYNNQQQSNVPQMPIIPERKLIFDPAINKVYTKQELNEKFLNQARFFMIKCTNMDNLELSIQHREWATTRSNQGKLDEAFKSDKCVILLFSVNKSSQFQGFARMASGVTNRQSNYWKTDAPIKLGGLFSIEWLRCGGVDFRKTDHMFNSNGDPIKKSRDSQEIPPEFGFQICNFFDEGVEENNRRTPHDGSLSMHHFQNNINYNRDVRPSYEEQQVFTNISNFPRTNTNQSVSPMMERNPIIVPEVPSVNNAQNKHSPPPQPKEENQEVDIFDLEGFDKPAPQETSTNKTPDGSASSPPEENKDKMVEEKPRSDGRRSESKSRKMEEESRSGSENSRRSQSQEKEKSPSSQNKAVASAQQIPGQPVPTNYYQPPQMYGHPGYQMQYPAVPPPPPGGKPGGVGYWAYPPAYGQPQMGYPNYYGHYPPYNGMGYGFPPPPTEPPPKSGSIKEDSKEVKRKKKNGDDRSSRRSSRSPSRRRKSRSRSRSKSKGKSRSSRSRSRGKRSRGSRRSRSRSKSNSRDKRNRSNRNRDRRR